MKNFRPILVFGVCCGFILNANAEGYQFPGGTGTASDPYQIVTAEDLDHVRDYLENSEVNFKLMNDIDLSEYLNGGSWQPIGNTTNNSFTGVFDGGNFTISNLVMLGGSDGLGFFGRIGSPGVVKNLTIDNAEVSGSAWCGILASTNGNWERDGGTISNCRVQNSFLEGTGSLGAIAGVNEGTIDGCSGINNIIEGSSASIGGLLGESSARSSNPRIINNFSQASILADGNNVGGLIGFLRLEQNPNYEAAIQNNATYGSASGAANIGGIVGYQQGITSTIYDNCYSATTVTGYQAGGIGGSPIDGKVQNCYASGNVISISGDSPWSGGIIGTAYQSITNCYFSGTISGEGKMGGICGRNWPSLVVENCYYNSDGASMNMGEGNDEAKFDAHGLLPEEMKSMKNFAFSQPDKWQIKEGVSYPYFKNQTDPITIEKCNLVGASGTCSANVKELFFSGSMSGGLLDVEVTVSADGTWTATWPDETVFANEVVYAFAKEDGKMPSQQAEIRVEDSGSVEALSLEGAVKVYSTKGYIVVKNIGQAEAAYQLINTQGQVMMSGKASGEVDKIATTGLQKGLYLLNVNVGKSNAQCYKVVVL